MNWPDFLSFEVSFLGENPDAVISGVGDMIVVISANTYGTPSDKPSILKRIIDLCCHNNKRGLHRLAHKLRRVDSIVLLALCDMLRGKNISQVSSEIRYTHPMKYSIQIAVG